MPWSCRPLSRGAVMPFPLIVEGVIAARSAQNGSGRKGANGMSITVRRNNGKTSIRLTIGALAITVEFPL